jgi:cell division protein FtsN
VQRDGVTLIVSMLGSTNMWTDAKHLLEYGFDNYDSLKSASQTTQKPATLDALPARQRLSTVITPGDNQRPKLISGYMLQVGAFRERERAEVVSRQISEMGFEPTIDSSLMGRGEPAYRVQVGPYAELIAAQEVAQVILNKNGYRSLILQLPVAGDAS